MNSRHIIRKMSVVFGLVAVLLLAMAPAVEAFKRSEEPSKPLKEVPRVTLVGTPFGPYRLIQPPAKRETKAPVTAEADKPKWTGNVYLIRKGDTLSAIAPHLKVSISKLASCSGIANPNRISIGQKLRKPGTCVAPVPASAPQRTTTNHQPKPATGAVENAISFAMAQLGDPYLWSGDGPNAWDCSGLVHAAFAHAGIAISRSTKTLVHEGYSVSRGAMVRGDLVFPDEGHVGIYLGNNKMVHAPEPGDVVKVSTVYDFYAARRIA